MRVTQCPLWCALSCPGYNAYSVYNVFSVYCLLCTLCCMVVSALCTAVLCKCVLCAVLCDLLCCALWSAVLCKCEPCAVHPDWGTKEQRLVPPSSHNLDPAIAFNAINTLLTDKQQLTKGSNVIRFTENLSFLSDTF